VNVNKHGSYFVKQWLCGILVVPFDWIMKIVLVCLSWGKKPNKVNIPTGILECCVIELDPKKGTILHHIFYITREQIKVTLFAFFEKENWSARLIQALYSLKKDMTEVIFGRDIGKFWQILIPFTMKSLKFSAMSFLYFCTYGTGEKFKTFWRL